MHLPATPLNLQQGRDWQLNGKPPNSEFRDPSNGADIVIIVLFWRANLCKPPSCTWHLVQGDTKHLCAFTNPRQAEMQREFYSKQTKHPMSKIKQTNNQKKIAGNGSIWNFGARNQALLLQLF